MKAQWAQQISQGVAESKSRTEWREWHPQRFVRLKKTARIGFQHHQHIEAAVPFRTLRWWRPCMSGNSESVSKEVSSVFNVAFRHMPYLVNTSDSHAYVISQHARWPIRTPRPTCANQDAWVVITPKWPNWNSIHTAAWHAWTLTLPLNFVLKAVFPLVHIPTPFTRLWPSRHSDLGDRDMAWGCS